MDDPAEIWTVEVRADTQPLQLELARMTSLGDQFGRAMTRSFQSVATGSKSVGEALRGLGLQLSNLVLKAAFKPLEQGIGSLFDNMLAGGPAFGNGAAFRQGAPTPFASGGVVASPTYFPMANGRVGLMGERGAEAIMPLARGPDGRLGVRADGASSRNVNVTMNIATRDAESFRRSEAQVSALLSRAVSQGQRNL